MDRPVNLNDVYVTIDDVFYALESYLENTNIGGPSSEDDVEQYIWSTGKDCWFVDGLVDDICIE